MDNMGDFLGRSLLYLILVLCFTIHSAWTLSADIMLTVNTSEICHQPLVCNHVQGNKSSSVIIFGNDRFAVAKSVRLIEETTVLFGSLSPAQFNKSYAQHFGNKGYDLCSLNCSEFFRKLNHVHVQSVHNLTKDGRQSLLDTLFQYYTQMDTILHATSSLLSRVKWKTNIMFTLSFEELTALSTSIQFSLSQIISFTMVDKANTTSINDTLNSLYSLLDEDDLNFIVVCQSACIQTFLHQAYQLELDTRKTSQWLAILTEGCADDLVNSHEQVPRADIAIIERLPCSDYQSSLTLDSLQEYPFNLHSNSTEQEHLAFAEHIKQILSLDDGLVSANVYTLLSSQSGRMVRNVGRISRGGDVIMSDDLFPGAKYGFNRRTLIVGILKWPPFVFKKEINGTATYSGLSIDLLNELSRTLNFSYTLVEPEDQEWGSEVNGKWTGLIGMLADKKVDLVAAPIGLLEAREQVMDFTIAYYYVQSGIIITSPDLSANQWMTLVAPFRIEVHICILFSLIFSTVFLFVVEEVHPVNTWTDNRLRARRIRIGDILWYHFGALMANGGAYLPSSQSGRSVLSCWWLFTVISAAIYSGNLIAFLTDWREKLPFSSLVDMANQDAYQWGTLGGTSFITIFKNSKRPEYQKIWLGMKNNPESISTDIDDHKNRLFGEKYAYLGDETLMEIWSSERCDLKMIVDQFLLLNYALGLQNNSAYTRLFSNQVLRISEIGLIRIWYRKWSSSVPCETSRSAKRVDLLALQSAFYAAGVGVLLALCVLVTEALFNRKCKDFTLPRLSDLGDNEGEARTQTRL